MKAFGFGRTNIQEPEIEEQTIQDYQQYDNDEQSISPKLKKEPEEKFITLEAKKEKLAIYKEKREKKLALKDLQNPEFKDFTARHYEVAQEQYNKQQAQNKIKSAMTNNYMFLPSIRDKFLRDNTRLHDAKITIPSNNKSDVENIISYYKNPVEHNQNISATENVKDLYMPRDFIEHTKSYETMRDFGNQSEMTTGEYIKHYQQMGNVTHESMSKAYPSISPESEIQKAFDSAYRHMHETHKKERELMTDENREVLTAQHKFEVELFNYKEKNILKPVELQEDKMALQESYIKFQEHNLGERYQEKQKSVEVAHKPIQSKPEVVDKVKEQDKSKDISTYKKWILEVTADEQKIQQKASKQQNPLQQDKKSILDKIKGLRLKI